MEMKIAENRWWSAQAALLLSHVQFWQYSSLHVVQEKVVAVLLLNLLAVSHVGMVALAWMPCYLSSRLLLIRMTMQSLHSLQGPPITRLSAPFSLPCAFAASSSSPCFGP